MHPGQAMRLRREKALETGSMEVHRHGKLVAICNRQYSGRWRVTMCTETGGELVSTYVNPEAAERASIAAAKADEAR